MAEKMYDKKLNIKTTGIREWGTKIIHYNRYEATPYTALDKLFQAYKIDKNHKVVDFGCGRGRVAFYIHNRFHVPVTGVEAHDRTYEEALNNKFRYKQKSKHIKAPIKLEYGLAEHYEIELTDNLFYLFNPFSVNIFKKVVHNILKSIKKETRPIDMILYYPIPEYKLFLNNHTPFQMINKIPVPTTADSLEKFVIYRYTPEGRNYLNET